MIIILQVTTTTDPVDVFKKSLHVQGPEDGNRPQDGNEGISLYGRTTKHNVCIKYCRQENNNNNNVYITYIFTQISIELKGNDRNLLFNLMEEIRGLSEFNMATEVNRTTELSAELDNDVIATNTQLIMLYSLVQVLERVCQYNYSMDRIMYSFC